MTVKQPEKCYKRLIPLHKVRRALLIANERIDGDCPEITEALRELRFDHDLGELIEYQQPDNTWVPGVVVAFAIGEPNYVCAAGDDRENPPEGTIFACVSKFIRKRQ